MADEEMKQFELAGMSEELPAALASASPHRVPTELRARVLRAAEARAGRSRALGARWLRPYAVAAALVLLIGLTVWNVQLQQGLADERTLLEQLRDSAKEAVIFEVIDSPGAQKTVLRAVGPQRPGEDPPYGKLYTNTNQTQVVVMAGRLPSPAAEQEYRLYLTDRSGTTIDVGPLRVDANGFGYLIYESGVRGPAFVAARLYLQSAGAPSSGGTVVIGFDSR
jgi:hypothetical protein